MYQTTRIHTKVIAYDSSEGTVRTEKRVQSKTSESDKLT